MCKKSMPPLPLPKRPDARSAEPIFSCFITADKAKKNTGNQPGIF